MFQKIEHKIINKTIVLDILTVAIFLVTVSGCVKSGEAASQKDALYNEVDLAISMVEEYDGEKEKRLKLIKDQLKGDLSLHSRQQLTDLLIGEYESYKSDSALFYVDKNLQNPEVLSNPKLTTRYLIKKADIAAHAGLFKEATDILAQINRNSLDSLLLEDYYSAYCDLFQYQSEYAPDSEFGRINENLRELYIDSISMVASPISINFIVNNAGKQVRNGNLNEAEKFLKENLLNYNSGDRNYSILTSILADVYRHKGDDANYHKYICESVISDIKGAVKENMAIRALATVCYEDGDLERADRYLRQSFADANFYSARMRNAQSSRMLPVIGEAYSTQQKKLNHELRLLVIFLSIVSLGFILIAIFAIIQVKKVRTINQKTGLMLEEVSKLSQQLRVVNKALNKTNEELQTSNVIKGEYAVLFMEYSSLAISALQNYQQGLKVYAAQGNMATLIKKIESGAIESKTMAEFYSKFDEAILNIYPNFVEKFNDLLLPEYRIVIKQKEGLTTELRVFALIRIGITDSEKIAKFLRCSLTTVYTYRSKMKKRALRPDTFEKDLLEL